LSANIKRTCAIGQVVAASEGAVQAQGTLNNVWRSWSVSVGSALSLERLQKNKVRLRVGSHVAELRK
jgi:hypothetical protein